MKKVDIPREENISYYKNRMSLYKEVQKLKKEGMDPESVAVRLWYAKSWISMIYNFTEEEMKQECRDTYEDQSLGKED
jgi:hypothetical protein